MAHDEKAKQADDHDNAAGAPGASGPGEPGYDGVVNLGEEGANPLAVSDAEPATED